MSKEIKSYGKIYNLGHKAITGLLKDPVVIEEKIDGSQFSMCKMNGELLCRSKGQNIVVDAPNKMFEKAIETAKELFPLLQEGWIYRGEYLSRPKHNSLAYDRAPEKYIILFEVDKGLEHYLTYEEKREEAERLGLEIVPCLYNGMVEGYEQLMNLLDRTSVLGGQKIEGFVIKNYNRFGQDGKVLMGKHVCEAFKEVHRKEWKKGNPQQKDILQLLSDKYTTKARWNKAIQHLREAGTLTETPTDIGALIKEVQQDINTECIDEIKDDLFKWAMPHILRASTRGLAEWYKELLVAKQFEEKEVSNE